MDVDTKTGTCLKGSYKRFLDPDSTVPISKTSRWRKQLSLEDVLPGDQDNQGMSRDNIDEQFQNSGEENDIEGMDFNHESFVSEEATGGNSNSDMEENGGDENSFPNSEFECFGAPLYPGSEITVAQCIVLILSHSLRHNLTACAIEDHLTLLSVILPSNNLLPQSLQLFRKMFRNPSDSINIHFFCKTCSAYLPGVTQCPECNEECDEKGNLKEGNFFISLSLADQLRDILEKEGCALPNEDRSDVCKGEMYQTLPMERDDISLLWNTDGVPVFNSSSYALWPIRAVINELPANVRFKNMLLAGVWFGQGKPETSIYLKQFVDDIKNINAHGVKWVHPKTKTTKVSKVFPILCSCDAVARCVVQGIHQFNGAYGCGHCLNEGKVVAKGKGYTRVYPPNEAERRTHNHVVECAEMAIEDGVTHVFGVKTASPLILLNPSTGFDMVNSFPVDYMHCVLLGVTKQFLDLWFNSKNHNSPWYIGTSKDQVDQRLLSIKPPSDVPRVPRTVRVAHKWKAAECRSWLLFYSGPVLHNILPTKFLKHWLLLVAAIFFFLKESISQCDLAEATSKIIQFVQEIPATYGLCHMSFNIHQLTHLPFSVRMHGPLWSTSAFCFEGHNSKLTRLCHGTNYIPTQIARQFTTLQFIPKFLKLSQTTCNISHRVDRLVNDWVGGYPLIAKAKELDGIVLLGCPRQKTLEPDERAIIFPLCSACEDDNATAEVYERAIVKGKVYTTENYGKGHTHNSYTVELRNGCIGVIKSIINVTKDEINNPLVQVQLLNTEVASFASGASVSHLKIAVPTATKMAVKPSDIVCKVVFMGQCNKKVCYVSLQPNSIELD